MNKKREKTIAVLLVTILALSFMGVFMSVSAVTPITVGPSGKDWTIIQDAIDAASAGDTIEVYTGTYTEDLSITVENLTLVGISLPVIDGVATGVGISAPANIWINADGFEMSGFRINSPIVGPGLVSGGMIINGTDIWIHANDFVSYATGTGENVAIQTLAATNDGNVAGLQITGNTFSGVPTTGYVGIYVNPDLDTSSAWVYVWDNDMTGYITQGIITERNRTDIWANDIVTDQLNTIYGNGIGAYGSNVALVQHLTLVFIEDNLVMGSGTGKGFNRGIFTGWLELVQTDVFIIENDVIGNNYGVLVRVSPLGVTVYHNNLVDNNINVANLVSGQTLDATLNWWGRPDIVGIITGTQGNIDADPWLDDPYPGGVARTSVGATGPQGDQGDLGATGPAGTDGADGATGADGSQGATGDTGATGATGPQGPKGNTGSLGATGSQGPRGSKGNTGSRGSTGATGQQGIQGESGEYGLTGLQGETGLTGPNGNTGETGKNGSDGSIGPMGLQGDTGEQGSIGEQGPPGETGLQGETGSQGEAAPEVVANAGLAVGSISLLGLIALYYLRKP